MQSDANLASSLGKRCPIACYPRIPEMLVRLLETPLRLTVASAITALGSGRRLGRVRTWGGLF